MCVCGRVYNVQCTNWAKIWLFVDVSGVCVRVRVCVSSTINTRTRIPTCANTNICINFVNSLQLWYTYLYGTLGATLLHLFNYTRQNTLLVFASIATL